MATQLKPLYSEYVELVRGPKSAEDLEERLLRSLKIDRDLLITYQLDKARTWYQTAPEDAFVGYAGAVNPTYITLSRRAHRDRFVSKSQPPLLFACWVYSYYVSPPAWSLHDRIRTLIGIFIW